MIAARESGLEVQGNMTGASYAAGIDDENMPHIISLFTDLYSDPVKAMLREYGTNGHDAHVEAGVSRPIEITLPNPMSPFLRVKDFGTGLDSEDIRKIYSRYGSSTKRSTNDQTGMLGLGCKSALTYSDQFTVESTKNGTRTICSISREEHGVPMFTVIASVPDDGENGTEVVIPIQRPHHMEVANKAAGFYAYWPEGSVLVNGEAPKRVDGLWLSDDLLLMKHTDYNRSRQAARVVMGNVAYPVDPGHFSTGLPSNYELVAWVPIGTVEFPPARESLMYTKTTRATLDAVKVKLTDKLADAVQKEVAAAKTPGGAIRKMIEWREVMGGNVMADQFKFGGKQMPALLKGHFCVTDNSDYKMGRSSEAPNGIVIETAVNCLVVTDFDIDKFTVTHKRKLLLYCHDKGISRNDVRTFALARGKIDTSWLDPERIVPWETIKAIKLPVATPTYRNGRPTGSYDALVAGTFQHIQADKIDQTQPIFYARGQNRHQAHRFQKVVSQHYPTATIVYLPENRYAKFARNFPQAKSLGQGCQEAYDTWAKGLSKDVKLALTIHDNNDLDTFRKIDPAKVKDPEIKSVCALARRVNLKSTIEAREQFKQVRFHINTTAVAGTSWTSPLDRYPLVAYMTYRDPYGQPDFYLYLNAAYDARKAS